MKNKVSISVLLWFYLCCSALAQSYPEGTPWAVGSGDGGVWQVVEWGGNQGFPAVSFEEGVQGDGRDGWSKVGAFMAFPGLPPLNISDTSSLGVRVRLLLDMKGDETNPNTIFLQKDGLARYKVEGDPPVPVGPWVLSQALGFQVSELRAGGAPPGYYYVNADGYPSRGGTLQGQWFGWYCPPLVCVELEVGRDGQPVPGVLLRPMVVCGALGTVRTPGWRPGVTGSTGKVKLLVPRGCTIFVNVSGGSGALGTGYQSGDTQSSFEVPDTVAEGFSAGAAGAAYKTYKIQLSTGAKPTLAESSASNGNDQQGGFWAGLWVPDAAKMEQLHDHQAYWSAWGPFGLGGQLAALWGDAFTPDDATALAALRWQCSGVLGQSYVDLRPMLNQGQADYSGGGRGSLSGSALYYLRTLCGLFVWASALFGLYKYLSPRFKA